MRCSQPRPWRSVAEARLSVRPAQSRRMLPPWKPRHTPRLRLAPPCSRARLRAAVAELGVVRRLCTSRVNEYQSDNANRDPKTHLALFGSFVRRGDSLGHHLSARGQLHSVSADCSASQSSHRIGSAFCHRPRANRHQRSCGYLWRVAAIRTRRTQTSCGGCTSSATTNFRNPRHTRSQMNESPNHALQRTVPRVTVAAISSSDPSRPSHHFL